MNKVLRTVVCAVLLAALSLASPKSAVAQTSSQSGNLNFTADKILIAVGAVAVGAIVTVVIVHNSGKRTITGCVNTGASGVGLTSDSDKMFYAFTGDAAGIKTGDRMTLKVKKRKIPGSKSFTWQPQKVIADLGPCPA